MTKTLQGFTVSGPISSISRETNCHYQSPDKEYEYGITDAAIVSEVIENAHPDGDSFADYSDEAEYISGGYMSFSLVDGVPFVHVKYYFDGAFDVDVDNDTILHEDGTTRALEYLLDNVIDETRGQLSDGIGEGFEQYPCYETDDWIYFISPGYPDMTVQYNYKEA